MIWVFWSAILFLAYTLAGYPLFLWLLSRGRNRVHIRAPIQPTVSIIIAAHNEGSTIRGKIVNCLQLAYPGDTYEVIVASDGSTDDSVAIVRSFADKGVKLIEIPERRGKQYAQREARDLASGEILVFTDAGVDLDANALQNIVSNFADPLVGCVSSEDRVTKRRSWRGEQSYVGLEMWIRRLESRTGSLVTASGSFFAARASMCKIWRTDQTSDFFVPLNTVRNGLRAIIDPESTGTYSLASSDSAELRRKIRTVVNGLEVFFTHADLLNPFRYGVFSWQLISHKLFRWLIPCAVLVLFVSNLALWPVSTFYRICLILQIVLYGSGSLALTADRLSKWKAIKLAGYFLLGNAATVIAWIYFLSGEKFVSWNPTQRG